MLHDRIDGMKILPAAVVLCAVSIVCCAFFVVGAINNKKYGRCMLLYSVAAGISAVMALAAVILFQHVSFFYLSVVLTVIIFMLLTVLTLHNVWLLKEFSAGEAQVCALKEELIQAQQPDETALRAKELLPIGNTFLMKAVDAIRHKTDAASILKFINKIMIKELASDGGVILTIGEFEDVLGVKAYDGNYPPPYKLPEDVPHRQDKVATNFRYAEFPLNGSFFGAAALQSKPILIANAQKDNRIVINGEEPFLTPGSLLTLPMVYHDTVAGLISVSRSADHDPFTESDVQIGEILTSYATAALRLLYDLQEETALHTIENETAIANRIQKILLPKKLIDTEHLGFSVLFNQARGVCSDYYDVIHTQKDRLFCITADVAGRSIHACIVMVMIRALIYLITNTAQSTQGIIDVLNKGITGKISIDHYASISLLAYSIEKKCIEYVNAGTQSLLLWKASTRKLMLLEQKTDPIGVDSRSIYTAKQIRVESGDMAVLFTDGIIETLNEKGEPFGLKAFAEILAANASLPAQAITEEVNKRVKMFMGKTSPHDDQTVMIIKVK